MAFGDEHFVVTRIPLRDEDGTLVGALGFVLFDRARHLKPLMSKYPSLQTQLVATQNALAKARRARYSIAGFIGNKIGRPTWRVREGPYVRSMEDTATLNKKKK